MSVNAMPGRVLSCPSFPQNCFLIDTLFTQIDTGPYVEGITKVRVDTRQEIEALIHEGNCARKVVRESPSRTRRLRAPTST